MKRVGYITDKDGRRITLLEAMGDYGNVQKAYNKARKCKRHRKDVLIFTKDKEENLDKVREDIINLAYEPSKYHYFKVYEPKERQIMALPFYDRVVQHAINNVLLYIAYEVVSIFKNMALCGLPVKKVWEKVREFLAKYTDELPDTDELDGDSTTGNVEEHRTQER